MKKRILVVDDDEHLRDALSAILSDEDHTVAVARDGLEALELLNRDPFDVILSDLRMPGLDGPALYAALQGMRHTVKKPRVIFMTGSIRGADYSAFLQGNTEPILEKPFSLDVARRVVSVLLNEQ
jgi:two-component system NtrC family sensor kinase